MSERKLSAMEIYKMNTFYREREDDKEIFIMLDKIYAQHDYSIEALDRTNQRLVISKLPHILASLDTSFPLWECYKDFIDT